MLNFRGAVFFAALVLAATIPCRADLVGSQVTGTMTYPGYTGNFFDPSLYGGVLVPAADLNKAGPTVTISATATEFGYSDGANTITADFTGTQLTLVDKSMGSVGWTITFTDSYFAGLSLNSPTNFAGFSFGSAGNTLTMTWAGVAPLTQSKAFTAVFDIVDPSPTPEPANTQYVVAGLAALGFWVQKRKRVTV